MAITIDTLKFFQSERMTDNSDGGGQMTANELLSGASNQIFDDISDTDRAVGDVSIRKIYAAVTSADTDKYLDAGVVIFREPADPEVSVLAFSTGSYYDERTALKSRVEQTISRGARWNGWLWGPHLIGQRVVVLWQRQAADLPATGQRLELVAKSGTVEQYSQYLWILRITESLQTRYESDSSYVIREVICELAEPLLYNFTGVEPSRNDPSVSSVATLFYDTRYNAEAVPMFGIRPMVQEATSGDYTVRVDSLYNPLIPTAFSETALPDVTPGGDSIALVSGNAGAISFTTTEQVVKPDVSLYLGSGALPGSVCITVSGSTLTDDNGVMKLTDAEVGTIDYGNGVIRWNASIANYSTASKVITFQPAARPLRVADTAAQVVTAENRGFVWVITLTPIPNPNSLRVSYRVNNVWYVLNDQGGGQLRGIDSSYGSGNVNFTTGTVTLTTGALPDVDSEIMYAWSTAANYTPRGGSAVDAPIVSGQTANPGIAAGTVTVTWATCTLTDSGLDGNLAGTGGTGYINYATGAWWVRPTQLPAVGTEFAITYEWLAGSELTQQFAAPLTNPDLSLTLELDNTGPIAPGSVRLEIPVESQAETGEYAENFTYNDPNSEGDYTWSQDSEDHNHTHSTTKVTGTIRCPDDGNGVILVRNGTNGHGVIDYVTGEITLTPTVATSAVVAHTDTSAMGTLGPSYTDDDASSGSNFRTYYTSYGYKTVTASFQSGQGTVTVRYRLADNANTATEIVTLAQLQLDLTRGFGETISANSVRFKIGTNVFVETAGQIYLNPSPTSGAGMLAGTIDRVSGRVYLSVWTGDISNSVTLESLTTEIGGQPIDEVVFRTPVAPLKPGTLQLRYTELGGAVRSKTVDSTGVLEDAQCRITVDYPLGVVRARFGLWKVDSELTPAEKLEPWYSPDYRVNIGGVLKIWKSTLVLADSIVYNAVAQTFLPPDSALLGLNAARLPPDGKALIYVVGRLALVHHTASSVQANLSPTQEINCGRTRLYRAVIDDANGARLPASCYTVHRETGIVTMAADLDLTGYSGPYAVQHTVADLARIVETDINGSLTLNRPVSHTYPAEQSRVSGVLFVGTLQARYTNLFAQSAWTSVWSDAQIGDAPLAQYNDVAYPIQVSNQGAYQDRILIKFVSSTTFQVIGENLGVLRIGPGSYTGSIAEDCSPVNQLTGQPYFTIDSRGWGTGWSTGNCVRFNLIAACYPVDLIRAIQPSDPTGLDDRVELLFIGNVDSE